MNAIPLKDATRRLGAPKNWNHAHDGICHTLEILDDEAGYMRSCWMPSPKELALLNAGHPVVLGIAGRVHPVVFLAVGDEPVATAQSVDGRDKPGHDGAGDG